MVTQLIAVERPTTAPRATLRVPGSKSLTCRAIVLGALADAPVELHGALHADDTITLLQAVHGMGVDTRVEAGVMHLAGGGPPQPHTHGLDRLDMGMGGAPARFTLALAALADAPIVIDGGARLRQRPMHDAVALLGSLGVAVEPIGEGPGLPLRVTPAPWATHTIDIADTATSQVVSSLLLVAANAGGLDMHFTQPPTSAAYIELTIDTLGKWGIDVDVQRADGVLQRINVRRGTPSGGVHTIAADASSAATAACMACALPGAHVTLHNVDPDDAQPDAAALTLLQRAGASLRADEQGLHIDAPDHLQFPVTVDASAMPDAVPVLAALAATQGTGPVRFTGLDTLRVKECDRIEGTRHLLHALGGEPTIEGDDLLVSPLPAFGDDIITLPSMDDHRMAMAGALLGLWRGHVRIDDADVVTKSWPTFWNDLAPLGGWARA